MFALILCCLLQQEQKIHIYLDDSVHAKMIEAECSRDWRKYGEDFEVRASRQEAVMKMCVLVKPKLNQKLFYTYSEHGEKLLFDERMFSDTGSILLTLEAIHANCTIDYHDWKTECDNITEAAQFTHYHRVLKWAELHFPDDIPAIYYDDIGINDRFLCLQEVFQNYDGCPIYVAPDLPLKPRFKYPWED